MKVPPNLPEDNKEVIPTNSLRILVSKEPISGFGPGPVAFLDK